MKWPDIFAAVMTHDQGNELINRFVQASGEDGGDEPKALQPA